MTVPGASRRARGTEEARARAVLSGVDEMQHPVELAMLEVSAPYHSRNLLNSQKRSSRAI